MVSNSLQKERSLPVLVKVTLVAQVINALAYASEFHLIRQLDREIAIAVALLVIASALVATGWRWTPLLSVLMAGGLLIGNPFLLYSLSQPVTSGFFLAALVQAISGVVVVIAGIVATVRNYRQRK
jgi:hypothetical protein